MSKRKRTIAIRVDAQRKDGSVRYRRNGRPVGAWIRAEVIDRSGPWVVTPESYRESGFSRTEFTVSHVPTGLKTCHGVSLAVARRLMRALAAMPHQAKWRTLKSQRSLTDEMKTHGRTAVEKVVTR